MKSVLMKSPGGCLRIYASALGVTQIDFLDDDLGEGKADGITDDPILLQAVMELGEYFAGKRRAFEVAVDLQKGTAFQREAWEILRAIPYGQTISYGDQAKAMGRPKAVRAVGGANGRNPLPILVPCHRVVSSAGKLHGFSGGLAIKRFLLAVEGLTVPT